ncbi:MAG: H4MPT-linked C1 transfer pathway protein [Candidatus Thorarchaeota archaeon]|nr:MAG: H4MPT-linked C1 transfer pathway protein [Candidatus Thorarchaeota archaeon]
MRVVGLDIGGANVKGCGISIDVSGELSGVISVSHDFPIWLRDRLQLWGLLEESIEYLAERMKPDMVSVVMTAELSDTFSTKREGVLTIVEGLEEILDSESLLFPTVDLELFNLEQAKVNPLSIAAANWPALAWAVGRKVSECLLIDIGSTTTDIIPISDGLPQTFGSDDTSRLTHGELVYTGALRTDLPAIVKFVNIDGNKVRVSSERFAFSADVHLVLSNITESQYTCDTADGRGKTVEESAARIARLVCGDIESLTKEQILSVASQVYEHQLIDIADGVKQVINEHELPSDCPVILSGLGAYFLGRPAAEKTNLGSQHSVQEVLGIDENVAETAYACALFAGLAKSDDQ